MIWKPCRVTTPSVFGWHNVSTGLSCYPGANILVCHPRNHVTNVFYLLRVRWKAENVDLCSTLCSINHWGFFSASHLLWNTTSIYKDHFRRPETLTPFAKRLDINNHWLKDICWVKIVDTSKSSSLLDSWAKIRKTEEIVKMTKKLSTKIVNFIIPTAGLLVLRHDHLRCIVRMHYFFKNRLKSVCFLWFSWNIWTKWKQGTFIWTYNQESRKKEWN